MGMEREGNWGGLECWAGAGGWERQKTVLEQHKKKVGYDK